MDDCDTTPHASSADEMLEVAARARGAARRSRAQPATAAQGGGARVHGHAHRPVPDARSGARRRAHHPQRRRPCHRRRDPLAERLPAPAGHAGDRRRHARGLRAARRLRGRVRAGARRRRRPAHLAARRLRGRRGGAAPEPRAAAREPGAVAREHIRGLRLRPRERVAARGRAQPAAGPGGRVGRLRADASRHLPGARAS